LWPGKPAFGHSGNHRADAAVVGVVVGAKGMVAGETSQILV
jgi:hypothetical protein